MVGEACLCHPLSLGPEVQQMPRLILIERRHKSHPCREVRVLAPFSTDTRVCSCVVIKSTPGSLTVGQTCTQYTWANQAPPQPWCTSPRIPAATSLILLSGLPALDGCRQSSGFLSEQALNNSDHSCKKCCRIWGEYCLIVTGKLLHFGL